MLLIDLRFGVDSFTAEWVGVMVYCFSEFIIVLFDSCFLFSFVLFNLCYL